MKISYKHLASLIEITETPEILSELLTATGLEVEGIEKIDAVPGGLTGLVIGEVLTCEPHPNADRLRKTTVDIGAEKPLEIVCGAANVAAGQKVVIATVGATLYPSDGEPFEIKKSKIRGEVSEGMICAEDEIGLGNSHDGIMVLTTDAPNGTPAAAHFKLESDYCIEIGLTPNRADAASHFGVARDVRALNGKEISLPETTGFKVVSEKTTFTISIQNEVACPRFCGLEIRGVTVKESPEWLKNFLRTVGVKSINNIVDTTNYINHFLGQPMHIFDADKVAGKQIVVRVPEKGTKVTTLDKIERELSGFDLAICDAEKPMAIAGVFGGLNSGVSDSTKNILLEVAYFDPAWIRKTATHHSLKTDASFRYERGTDPEMPPFAIKAAALMIQNLAGGECLDGIIDLYPKPIEHKEVTLKYRNINRLIGKEIGVERIHEILESLDIKTLTKDEQQFTVSVPPYRVDVSREADVIEV
ncbi:MAG: phenylalanine--tRNA ligase subunit beta, partial [Spirosomaceae bacterium]|nr:phenylalanine--tRNA ligase subunit beta [Spirosomataceae bacterium]